MRFAFLVALAGCQPAPIELPPAPPPARAVVELYMHADGKTNCVEQSEGEWRANATCCPDGFSPAGFSAPAATLYLDADGKPARRLFRHLVCMENG
ncbi:MAG: hypothetical protein KC912_00155 [Proteobacteria bacterium]|nr:hypothetical protein [Pseudomonadota bacterium]